VASMLMSFEFADNVAPHPRGGYSNQPSVRNTRGAPAVLRRPDIREGLGNALWRRRPPVHPLQVFLEVRKTVEQVMLVRPVHQVGRHAVGGGDPFPPNFLWAS